MPRITEDQLAELERLRLAYAHAVTVFERQGGTSDVLKAQIGYANAACKLAPALVAELAEANQRIAELEGEKAEFLAYADSPDFPSVVGKLDSLGYHLQATTHAWQSAVCAKNAHTAPAPAGWPSDEAIARAIYTEGDDFTDDDWALCKRRDAKGVDRAREEAAAVQRLYAPLRERLERYEAALAETPENIRAMVTNAVIGYEDARWILARLRRVAQGEAQP